MQRAPTGFNVQPYAVVIVRAKEDREKLSAAMLGSNGAKVLSAPLVAVFAGHTRKKSVHLTECLDEN